MQEVVNSSANEIRELHKIRDPHKIENCTFTVEDGESVCGEFGFTLHADHQGAPTSATKQLLLYMYGLWLNLETCL